jgi:hypothetical protein
MQVFFQGQFINDFIYKISLQYFFFVYQQYSKPYLY